MRLAAARSLAGLGVVRGDRVGLLMPNCPDFVFAFFGIQLLGAVAVPLNTRFRARELSYVIEHAGLVALLTSDIADEAVDFVERLGEALPGLAGQPTRRRSRSPRRRGCARSCCWARASRTLPLPRRGSMRARCGTRPRPSWPAACACGSATSR